MFQFEAPAEIYRANLSLYEGCFRLSNHDAGNIITIGSVGGSINTGVMGHLGLCGPAFFAMDFKDNILSVPCYPHSTLDPDHSVQERMRGSPVP